MLHDVEATIIEQKDIARPEYVRLPRPGARCALTGLSRSTLAELAVPCETNEFKPPVKSVVIRKRNAIRGIRLVHLGSLLDHLRSLETVDSTNCSDS